MRSRATSGQRNALTAGIFVVAYGTNVSTPFLVEYRRRLNLTESATVAIFVFYVVGIIAALLLAGPMSDRFGRRPIVLPMTALSGIASLVMIVGRDEFVWLLFGRFLLGVVSGAVLGVGTAWLLELYGPGEEQRAAVRITLVTYAGFGIGPVISALMFWLVPSPLVFAFAAHAAASLAVIGLMLRVPETHPADAGQRIRVSLGVPPAARQAFVVVIVPAAIWVFGFPSAGFALFPVLVGDSIGVSDVGVAAAAGALTAWSGLLSRPLVVRIGPRAALPLGMAMGTAGYIVGTVAFAADLWPLVLIAAPLLGAASGTIMVACLSLIGVMADDARRGSLTSSFYLMAYPGMAMPLLITTLADLSSTSGVLIGVSVVAAGCSLVVLAASRRDIVGA
ncbi:MAG: MFS transporter [Ilumatobacter sp.]|uniref:MFS transporter n=1 Tax=Ilumatobacter sp. TaxID=1967498 RepID=UPI0037517427|nr:MFS transporter [Ilumatobacter sp.]